MACNALACAAAALLTGCILLVDSSPTGDQFTTTCAPSSSSSACAKCIASTCGAQLTACCGDQGCRPMLSEIDQCANDGGCTLGAQGDAGAPLALCVTSSCPSCSGTTVNDASPTMGFDCYSDNISGTCSCRWDATPNNVACDVSVFGGETICCADPSYQLQTGQCKCAAVTCNVIDSSLCTCSLGNGGTPNTTCDGSFGTCCLSSNGTTCECIGNGSCSSGTLVSSCSGPGVFSCTSSQITYGNCR